MLLQVKMFVLMRPVRYNTDLQAGASVKYQCFREVKHHHRRAGQQPSVLADINHLQNFLIGNLSRHGRCQT